MLVSPASSPAFQKRTCFTRLIHVSDNPAGFVIINHRTHRYLNQQVVTAPAGTAVRFSVFAVLCRVLAPETEIKKRVHVLVCIKQNIPAVSAVSAIGTAVDHEFFPVEGRRSVSAVSCFRGDPDTIDKITHNNL